MTKPFEKLFISFFDESYGTDLHQRIPKLKEEFDELIEAYNEFAENPNENTWQHMKDELSDTQAVLAHITSIMDSSYQELIVMAHKKARMRSKNPNYKRE